MFTTPCVLRSPSRPRSHSPRGQPGSCPVGQSGCVCPWLLGAENKGQVAQFNTRCLTPIRAVQLCAENRINPASFVPCLFPTISETIVLWQKIIQRHGGVITNALNLSCLAKVTDGFTQGHIVRVVRAVLTDRRLRQQPHKPLVALDFMAALSTMDPIYQEEEDNFKVIGAHRVSAANSP